MIAMITMQAGADDYFKVMNWKVMLYDVLLYKSMMKR